MTLKHAFVFVFAVIVAAFGSEETQTAKIVAIKTHAQSRIISWQGNSPSFDGYPFYDITLDWKGKKYNERYESQTGYYPEDWKVGNEVHVQRERGAFRILRGSEA